MRRKYPVNLIRGGRWHNKGNRNYVVLASISSWKRARNFSIALAPSTQTSNMGCR
jgi:hypothetical protein